MTLPRYRSRGALAPAVTESSEQLWSDCSNSSFTTVAGSAEYGTMLGEIATMHDVVTPNYRSLRQAGGVVFNACSSVKEKYETSGGSGIHVRNLSSITCSGVPRFAEIRRQGDQLQYLAKVAAGGGSFGPGDKLVNLDSFTPEQVQSFVDEASTRCLNERGRFDANLWETLAETDKSLRLLTDLHTNVRKALTGVSNRAVFRSANGFASAYLLYRYGLKPLVSDISHVLSNLEASVGARKRQSSRGSIQKGVSSLLPYVVTHGVLATTIGIKKTDSIDVRALSLDEFIMSKADRLGLSAKGLITLPWELIPYSFVVDWFVNVGDFIGAISPAPGLTQLCEGYTVRRTVSTAYTASGTTCPGGTHTVLRPVSGTVTATRVSYTRNGGLTANVVIKSDFRFSNLTRCLDAISLVVQRLQSMTPRARKRTFDVLP